MKPAYKCLLKSKNHCSLQPRLLSLLILVFVTTGIFCRPTINFYLDTLGIGSESIYLNDMSIGCDKTIAVVGENNQPDILICIGNDDNCTHEVVISKLPSISSKSVHFSDMSIGCDRNLYITDIAFMPDIKYAFTDDPQKADVVIYLKDQTLSINKKTASSTD